MIRRLVALPLGLGVGFMLWAPAVLAQPQPTLEELRQEIQALRGALVGIQRDLQDIKALLQPPQQPPETRQTITLDLTDRPFRGEQTAPITLVEFTDYQ